MGTVGALREGRRLGFFLIWSHIRSSVAILLWLLHGGAFGVVGVDEVNMEEDSSHSRDTYRRMSKSIERSLHECFESSVVLLIHIIS